MKITRVLALCAMAFGLGAVGVGAVAWRGQIGETRPLTRHGHGERSITAAKTTPPVPKVLEYIPNYFEHVKPILEANCLTCHTDGGIGPFKLSTLEAAQANHRQIYTSTRARHMPPFPPSGESPKFQHDTSLSNGEIAILANWSWAGAPAGRIEKSVSANPRVTPLNIRQDALLRMTQPFRPNANLSDEYRCFMLDPKTDAEQFITGYEVLPGNPKLVHHVLVFELEKTFIPEAQRLMRNETDGRDGYTCFGNAKFDQDLQPFAVWAPGAGAVRFPTNVGARLKAGSKIVIQVHYNLANGTEPDQSGLKLEYAQPGDKLIPMINYAINAPVELRCPDNYPSDPKNVCHRDAAYDRVLELNNSQSVRNRKAGTTLTRCKRKLEDFTTQPDVSHLETSCEYNVPIDLKLHGIAGHMHYLGTSVKIEVSTGTQNRRVLLDLPEWDFHWQGFYWLEQAQWLRQGETVRITCTFDNTKTNQPFIGGQQRDPRYVVWGEGTEEEMCLGYVQTTLK